MRTFLLTWKQEIRPWETLFSARVQSGQRVSFTATSGNQKHIEKGDRLFLLKQGADPKGIIGSGWATGECYRDLHWDNSRASQQHYANYVPMIFDQLVHPDSGEILPISALRFGRLAGVKLERSSFRDTHPRRRGSGVGATLGAAPRVCR
ncbi:MAG: hypothetical protein AABN33_21540 [Acidobacteriota bacterium]